MKNYYEVLNIPIDASLDKIKKMYRKLVKKYHPDVNKSASDMFHLITEAYSVLSDSEKRIEYNKKLLKLKLEKKNTDKRVPKVKVIYSRSLGELAKRGFFLSSIPKKYRKKADIKYDVEVIMDYNDYKKSKIISITVPIKIPCPECNGTDLYCHLCDGKGYLVRSKKLNILLPDTFSSGEIFEIDLQKIRKQDMIVFRANKLRLKIIFSNYNNNVKKLTS